MAEPTPAPTPTLARRWWWVAGLALLFLATFTLRPIPWNDSLGAIYGPVSFACEGDWDFDEFPFLYESAGRGSATVPFDRLAVQPMAHGVDLGNLTGLGVKLAALPSLAITRPWWRSNPDERLVRANATLSLVWVLLFAFSLPRLAGRWAIWAPLAAVGGTVLLPQVRHTMWNYLPALPALGLLLREATRSGTGASRWRWWVAGPALGWALLCRPVTLVLAGPLWLAGPTDWKERARSLLLAAPFLALLALDNLSHTGSLFGFPQTAAASALAGRTGGSTWAFSPMGVLGVLISPSRGLLVFSPWAALGVPGFLEAWRRDGHERRLAVACASGVGALVLLNDSYVDWWGMSGWGPRRLAEATPALLWLASRGRRPGRVGWGLLGLALAIQLVGLVFYDSRWDNRVGTGESSPDVAAVEEALWSWRDGAIVDALGRPPDVGRDAAFTLAPGQLPGAPIPPCEILRTVDRWPRVHD